MEEKHNTNLLNTMMSVIDPLHVFRHHETAEREDKKPRRYKFTTSRSLEALVFLAIFFAFFGLLAYKMTLP
ncbi:MAG: hypothetical protein J6W95_07270, partial [Bacteroidales bacterium]|nr:hypothetical protein [Bacteroidales bacterium]